MIAIILILVFSAAVAVNPSPISKFVTQQLPSHNTKNLHTDLLPMSQFLVDESPFYRTTDEGILYSKSVITAIHTKDGWITGPIVPSQSLKKGEHVWWPSSPGFMKVLEVEHHNVTIGADSCCWAIQLGFPDCHYKYCCGSGCCC